MQTKDFTIAKKNGLDSSYFPPFEAQFDFISKHLERFGNVPDVVTFLDNFPEFPIDTDVNETDEYLLDRLYEEYGFRKFAPFLSELNKKVLQNSRDAYDYMLAYMSNLKPHAVVHGIDIIKEAKERYDLYANRQEEGYDATISSGMIELDDIFGGWEYGEELVTIVARTNQGKSWLCLKFLTEAWKQGKKVGLYSGEMSHIKLGYRFDALFKNFSNKALMRGRPAEGYKDYIDALSKNDTPFHIITQKEFGNRRPTIPMLRQFIEENELDILGIDQYSLVETH